MTNRLRHGKPSAPQGMTHERPGAGGALAPWLRDRSLLPRTPPPLPRIEPGPQRGGR